MAVSFTYQDEAEQHRADYLALLPETYRSQVTNLFLSAARAGLHKPSDVLEQVRAEADHRLADAQAYQDRAEYQKWSVVLDTLDTGQALYFAGYCVNYCQLSPDERKKLRARRALPYVDRWMEVNPVTPSQLTLLRRLGWNGDPPVMTRAEAAELLTALINRGRHG